MNVFERLFPPFFFHQSLFFCFIYEYHLKKKNLAVGRANFENNNKLLRRIF
jgi:hypothetical protein